MTMNTETNATPQAILNESMPLDNPANCSATASSPAEWLLPGLIPKNQVTLLSGDDGRLVMDMCMDLATGKPFWGFPATPKVPILFVTTERKNKVHAVQVGVHCSRLPSRISRCFCIDYPGNANTA